MTYAVVMHYIAAGADGAESARRVTLASNLGYTDAEKMLAGAVISGGANAFALVIEERE